MTFQVIFGVVLRRKSYEQLALTLVTMLAIFPIGVATFVGAVVAVAVPGGLMAAPFIYGQADINFGSIVIDTMGEAVIVSGIGFVLVLIELDIANAAVALFRRSVSVRIGNVLIGRQRS